MYHLIGSPDETASNVTDPLTPLDQNENTSTIKMPPTMRKRGRPKGAGLTVIGLPKKKGKMSLKPSAFILKSDWEKTKGLFIGNNRIPHSVIFARQITESFLFNLYSYAWLVC